MAKVQDRYLVVDPWKIVEDGFHSGKSRVSESLFSLSNEHMGVRGYFEEQYSGDTLIGCYLNGIYEEHFLAEPTTYKGISNRIAFMVNTVNWLHARIELDGESLDLGQSHFEGFRRELDFHTGQVRREFTWTTKAGHELKVCFSRFLSMQTNEIGFGRISLTPLNFSGPIDVTLGVDFTLPHEMYRRNFWDCPRSDAQADRWAIVGVSKNIKHKLFAGSRLLPNGSTKGQPICSDKFAGSRLTVDLTRGTEKRIDRAAVLFTTRNPNDTAEDTWARGSRILDGLVNAGYDEALEENRAYWTSFWDKADITIDGDPEAHLSRRRGRLEVRLAVDLEHQLVALGRMSKRERGVHAATHDD